MGEKREKTVQKVTDCASSNVFKNIWKLLTFKGIIYVVLQTDAQLSKDYFRITFSSYLIRNMDNNG